jgi:hypothetical protein
MKTDDFLADFEHVLHDAAVRRLQTGPSIVPRRPRRARRRVAVLGLSLTAIAAVIATALTLVARTPTAPGPSADERPAPTLTPEPTPTPAGRPKPPRYSVLDGPTVQLDRTRYDAFLEDPVIRRMGLNWNQLRAAIASLGVTVYAAPGKGGQLCIVNSGRYGTSMGCIRPKPGEYAATYRFGLGTRGGTIVSGLLPDGASDVRVQTGTTTVPVKVINNGFVARIGDEAATLRWTDNNGSQVQQFQPSPAAPTPTPTPR